MDKIQVGKDVWIKPNKGEQVPQLGDDYYTILPDGKIVLLTWHNFSVDYALLNSGNFFPTREAAEAAIIKPVDPTPIAYERWVEAGRPAVWALGGVGDTIITHDLAWGTAPFWFAANKRWLTREAAEAWLAKWHAENGSAA